MSRIHFPPIAPPRNWLTATALWTVIVAWGGLGVWGWLQTAEGPAAFILVALAVAAQIIAARMLIHAGGAGHWTRALACLALGLGCLAFTGLSGKRALDMVEARRLAPIAAAQAKHEAAAASLAKIEAQFPAPVLMSANVPAERVERLTALRTAELARLEPELQAAKAAMEAAPMPPPALPVLPGWLGWAIVALIEALEFAGFWAIGAGRSGKPTQSGSLQVDPSEAGRRLVALRKDRKAA